MRIGTMMDVPVVVQPGSVLFVVVLVALWGYEPGEGWTRSSVALGALLVALIIGSVFLHELGHAYVARLFGRKVHYIAFSLWGAHTTTAKGDNNPRPNALISAVGPAVNVVLGGIGIALAYAGLPESIGDIALTFAVLNFILAFFNALPALPLDGGHALVSVVWAVTGKETTGFRVVGWSGRAVAVLIGVAPFALAAARGSDVRLWDVILAGLILSYLWPAARRALAFATVKDRIHGISARALMAEAVAVDHRSTVAEALAAATRRSATAVIVLAEDGAPAGWFTTAAAAAIPSDRRAETSLMAVIVPVPRGAHIDAEAAGQQVLVESAKHSRSANALIVMDATTPVGVLSIADIEARLQGKS